MKDTKELFSKHFPRHFQSFCCKIHVYWVINSLPPVCSHAIRTILMVWVRITLGFQPRVIRTQTINIFSYCMNKQGITNNIVVPCFVDPSNLPICWQQWVTLILLCHDMWILATYLYVGNNKSNSYCCHMWILATYLYVGSNGSDSYCCAMLSCNLWNDDNL